MSIILVLTAALLPAILLWLYIWKKDLQPEPTSWLRLNHDVTMEMAGSSHTPASCLSKLRSSLEAGKKQLRVWLQYVCGVKEMHLYPTFGAPLFFLCSPYDDSEMARNGFLDEPSGKAEREDGSKCCATGNICSSANEAGFVDLRTYVHGCRTHAHLRKCQIVP